MTSTSRLAHTCDQGSQLPVDFNKLKFIAHGTSGVVYAIDEHRVLKEYYDAEDGAEERKALDRLGPHPNIIAYYGNADQKSIVLERGIPLLSLSGTSDIRMQDREAWIKDLAEGLLHIHKHNIVHGDVGCENMVLVKNRVKIIDFEGCAMDGKDGTAAYKWHNRRDLSVDTKSDIFAYGCVVYQILTGKTTLFELAEVADRDKVARRLWSEKRFPDVRGLRLDSVMLGCWSGELTSMEDVVAALDSASRPRGVFGRAASLYRWLVSFLT
ncbi:Protein kinase-like domain protein [Cordyceps fumosorosea ARSEF 2679]|uniref:Protein kinase-like domain protein n=1 Tax=Cordyceps fumosorosea (strain ARSEF 2679) TaxID=1081104 RepID=A0A167IMD8_CORFA|nr:Protein kinase-like domain protein [Cordyceps fumosorosea ARSEF 2679]OAA49227.1 Protein kinase-like domain protein [Cordyceps fumosorosea ARSEF 2679]